MNSHVMVDELSRLVHFRRLIVPMKAIFNKRLGRNVKDEVVTIVSGLPRSGTSMMMQMLEAGGMPIVTDTTRKPDKDNPRGYYEFEKVKQIKEDASWLEHCYGKAVKVVSALLYHLPKDKHYKVIFMKREMEEILFSQRAMLQRLGEQSDNVSDKDMAQKFEKHLRDVGDWLSRQSSMDVIYVKYNDVIKNPHENARLVNRFLNNRLSTEQMAHVVDKSLHRQKKD